MKRKTRKRSDEPYINELSNGNRIKRCSIALATLWTRVSVLAVGRFLPSLQTVTASDRSTNVAMAAKAAKSGATRGASGRPERCLVTGGTGNVGASLVATLIRAGHDVLAIARNPDAAKAMLDEFVASYDDYDVVSDTGSAGSGAGASGSGDAKAPEPGVLRVVRGDVTKPDLGVDATGAESGLLRGYDWWFHCAGLPEQYLRDEAVFHRVNAEGTQRACEAAHRHGAKRMVCVSTMDVFACPPGGTLVETNEDTEPKHTAYERSKQEALRLSRRVSEATGLDIVTVNPSAVFGPLPRGVLTGLSKFAAEFLTGQVPLIPPSGMPVVYNRDCARATVAAARSGRTGECYLLSNRRFMTLTEIGVQAARAYERECDGARRVNIPPNAPFWLLKLLAHVTEPVARLLGVEPLVATSLVTFLSWMPRVDASKAAKELGFRETPFEDAMAATVRSLIHNGDVSTKPSGRGKFGGVLAVLVLLCAAAAGYAWLAAHIPWGG